MADPNTSVKRGGRPAAQEPGIGLIEATIDFNVYNQSADEVVQMLDLEANTLVLEVGWEVITAEGGTLTFDVGDGDDVDGYVDGANGNSAASGFSSLLLTEAAPNTVTGYRSGKLYAAADTIDLIPKNDADTAKIRVWALVLDVSRREGA